MDIRLSWNLNQRPHEREASTKIYLSAALIVWAQVWFSIFKESIDDI